MNVKINGEELTGRNLMSALSQSLCIALQDDDAAMYASIGDILDHAKETLDSDTFSYFIDAIEMMVHDFQTGR